MMSWEKIVTWRFFLFLLVLVIIIVSPSKIQAATNKTWCRLNEAGQCVQKVDCNPGCVPPILNCSSRSSYHCEIEAAPYDCNCAGPGTLECRWKDTLTGGTCRRYGSCGPGYEPSPHEDPCLAYKDTTRGACESADAGTCVQSTIPQPVSPGITCDICGCDPVTHQKSDNCPIPKCNLECSDCVYSQSKSWTAIGCLPTNEPQEFVAWLLARAIGIAGGIAFLLMIFAGFQIITSAGDPKKLQSGKELLTSAIVGLIVIIFSLFLLQLIGVEILKIPGFGE